MVMMMVKMKGSVFHSKNSLIFFIFFLSSGVFGVGFSFPFSGIIIPLLPGEVNSFLQKILHKKDADWRGIFVQFANSAELRIGLRNLDFECQVAKKLRFSGAARASGVSAYDA